MQLNETDVMRELLAAVKEWFVAASGGGEPVIRWLNDAPFENSPDWFLVVEIRAVNKGSAGTLLEVNERRPKEKLNEVKVYSLVATRDTETGTWSLLKEKEEIWDDVPSPSSSKELWVMTEKRDGQPSTDIRFRPPQNKDEYIDLVERFSGLVDLELKRVEGEAEPGRAHAIALRFPALVSLVNTIGYLRGEDGVFLDVRPEDMHGSGRQGDLYKNEEFFEKRLIALATEIMDSKEAEFAKKRLEMYYVQMRLPR